MDVFTSTEKAVLSLVVIPVAGIWFLGYKYATRFLSANQSESDAYLYLYSGAVGVYLGQIFGSIIPNSTNSPYALFNLMVLGICIIASRVTFQFFRIMTLSVHDFNPDPWSSTDVALCAENSEQNDFLFVGTEEEINDVSAQSRKASLLIRFQRIHVLILFCACIILNILDSLYVLTIDTPKTAVITSFWISKLLQAYAILCMTLFSKFHRLSNTKGLHALFIVLSSVWCLSILLSLIPIYMHNTAAFATNIIHHPATTVFYAIAGAQVTVMQSYMALQPLHKPSAKYITTSLVICLITFVSSWMSGYFINS